MWPFVVILQPQHTRCNGTSAAPFATAPAHTVSLGPLRRPHWSGSTFTTLYPPSRSAQQLQPSRNTAATIVPKRHLPASSYAPPTHSALVCLGVAFSLLRALRIVLRGVALCYSIHCDLCFALCMLHRPYQARLQHQACETHKQSSAI